MSLLQKAIEAAAGRNVQRKTLAEMILKAQENALAESRRLLAEGHVVESVEIDGARPKVWLTPSKRLEALVAQGRAVWTSHGHNAQGRFRAGRMMNRGAVDVCWLERV